MSLLSWLAPTDKRGLVLNHEEYGIIVKCNELIYDITEEISQIHKFIQHHYAPKFPELEQFVMNPVDYARVVKAIGNETV